MTIGPVITDENYQDFIQQGARGYNGMWLSAADKAKAKTFGDIGIELIPENDIDDIIETIEKLGADPLTLTKELGLPCLDQSSTNFCWVNAPTHCCEYVRLCETGQVFSYSPASAGAPIKGFRNSGGWGSQALEYFKEYGLNETKDWPANAISRTYYTSDNRAKQAAHKTLEYYVLESWQERFSCWMAGIWTADGYPWWSHEVCGCWLVKKSHDLIFRNSWGMSYGERGFGTLTGSRKQAGDSVAITAMKPL